MSGLDNPISIRPEAPGDEIAISALTTAAFRDMAHSNNREAAIIDQMRADGDLTLSLVAENMDKAVVGHIAFSPVTISDKSKDWYALGPVSVIPVNQSTGIGSALIRRGLADLQVMGAKGCVLLGNPAYYERFNFEHDPQLSYPGPPPEFFQRLVLEGEPARGFVNYPPAFDDAR